MSKEYVIVAPHADDEIIGCYSLLKTGKVKKVVFGTVGAMMEAEASSHNFDFSAHSLDNYDFDTNPNEVLFFPDPTTETHPEHRRIGMLGEELLRAGREVVFYSTNMSAPYISEQQASANKLRCLNNLYPLKKALWKYEHKYFLFEGYTLWIMKCPDLF
jgi:hypothetical protein